MIKIPVSFSTHKPDYILIGCTAFLIFGLVMLASSSANWANLDLMIIILFKTSIIGFYTWLIVLYWLHGLLWHI